MGIFTNRFNNVSSSVTPPGGGNIPPPQGPQNNPSAPDPSGGGGRLSWVKPYISGVGSKIAVDKGVEIVQASGLQERKLSFSNKQHTRQLSFQLQEKLYEDKIGLDTYVREQLDLGYSKISVKNKVLEYLKFKDQTNSLPPAYRDLFEMNGSFSIETKQHQKEVVEVAFHPNDEKKSNTIQGPRKSPPFASIMNQPSHFPELRLIDPDVAYSQIRRQEQLEVVGFWASRILGLVLVLMIINRIMCGYWISPNPEKQLRDWERWIKIDEYYQRKNNNFSAGVPSTDKVENNGSKSKYVVSTVLLRRNCFKAWSKEMHYIYRAKPLYPKKEDSQAFLELDGLTYKA